jgi:hypothetical protein
MPKNKNDSGVYIIKLKKPAFGFPAGRIIYIGKGKDVQTRRNQEIGKEKAPATFFRSIGVVLNKTVIPGSGKNYRFKEHDEIVNWLYKYTKNSIIMCDPQKEEKRLIKKHRPPFNIIYNSKHCFLGLRELRKKAKAIAMKTT